MTNASGYNLMLYRIIGDAAQAPVTNTKGPLMLMHGMFSNTFDWLERTDTLAPALPF